MKDTTVATIRTVTPIAWAGVVVDLIRRKTGVELTETQVLAVAVAAGGVLYRAGRELERRWPALGRILFGSPKTPTYNAQEG